MKITLVLMSVLLLCLCSIASAGEVTLEWDPSITANVQGYTLYDRNFQKPYDYESPICSVPDNVLNCLAVVPDDRQTAFVARAWIWGPYDLEGNRLKEWSDNSNEAVHTPEITPPQPPGNLIKQILQVLLDFFEPSPDSLGGSSNTIHLTW